MFDCNKTQPLLAEFAKMQLEATLQDKVEQHLQTCESCSQDFEMELNILANLSGLSLICCPAQVTENILLQIESEEDPKTHNHNRFWFAGVSGLAAAALALFLLGPISETNSLQNSYSNQEIQSATREAQWALARVVSIIDQNEKNAFKQVFGQEIPEAVGGSLRLLTKNLQGDV